MDEQLAAGRISADEYRVRRDRILTSAVGSGDEAAGQAGSAGPAGPVPGPPPQPAGDEANRTQKVDSSWRTVQPESDGDRTQIVPGVPRQTGLGGQPPRPAPPGPYPGQGPGQGPAQGQFGAPPPQWEQEQPPPWGGQEFPPLVPTGTPDWLRQGPEVFDDKSGSNRTKFLIIGLVVVVALGVGSYFLFFANRGNSETTGQTGTTTEQTTPESTTPPKPKDDLSAAELPGKAEDHSNITTFADAAASKFLTEDEVAIYQEAGADESRLVASTTEDKVHTLIFTSKASSPTAAETASEQLVEQQLVYGMTEYDDAPAGVDVAEFPGNETTPATIRAHYHHKSTIIRIQVNGADMADVVAVFEDLVEAQLEVLGAKN